MSGAVGTSPHVFCRVKSSAEGVWALCDHSSSYVIILLYSNDIYFVEVCGEEWRL